MMLENKTQGQQFLEILDLAKESKDKNKMFDLLRSTLEKINPFPTEKVNFKNVMENVTDMDSVAAVKAARAEFNAYHGAYMFADDYIYLTAKAYKDEGLGNIESFKHDFTAFTAPSASALTASKTKDNQQQQNVALYNRRNEPHAV
jgi:hypothetical protein